jgi:hypothetical protein
VLPMQPTRTLHQGLPPEARTGQPHRLATRRPRTTLGHTLRRWRRPSSQRQGLLPSPHRGQEDVHSIRAESRLGFSLRLICTAWIRNSDSVFMTARKSMTVRTYLHSSRKRAETTVLLDSGATENFMNLGYAKWLSLPICYGLTSIYRTSPTT